MCIPTRRRDPLLVGQQRVSGADSRPTEFSRGLKVFAICKLGKNAAHGFFSQAGISIHDLGDGQASGERL